MTYLIYRYFGAFAALTLTFMSATPAASEKLSQEWQRDRDYYGIVTNLACEGDRSAYRELRRAAVDLENPVAQNNMAWLVGEEDCLFEDRDMDMEYAYALQYHAADAGYPIAINNYGNRLMKGVGVRQSSERAIRYLEWAIEKDYGTAALAMAGYYIQGEYIGRDYAKAAEFLRLARADAGPDEQRPDANTIANLARSLDDMSASEVGHAPLTQQPLWATQGSTAVWGLVARGRLKSEVFVEADGVTGQMYFGFRSNLNDPVIHFMGASVKLSDGRELELNFDQCGGRNCLDTLFADDQTLSTRVTIPIIPSQREFTLNAMKSGDTINFRYQTQDSSENNNFINYTFDLRGSREAIEQVERMAAVIANEHNRPQVDYTSQPPVPITPQASAPIIEQAAGNSSGFYYEDMLDGDVLCPASEISEFPPYFYTEIPSSMQGVFEGPYASPYVKPATTDFLRSAGTTVWHAINQHKVVLYRNGRVAFARASSYEGVQIEFEGTWEFDAATGLQMSASSVPGFYSSTEHLVCSGGTLAIDQGNAQSPSGMRNWQTCDIILQCQRWRDGSEGNKREETAMLILYEWSPEIVSVTGLRALE